MDLKAKLEELRQQKIAAKEFYIKICGAEEYIQGLIKEEETPKDKKEKK